MISSTLHLSYVLSFVQKRLLSYSWRLSRLSRQDQMIALVSFHIWLLSLWIILSFINIFCHMCLMCLICLNFTELLAWKNKIFNFKLFSVFFFSRSTFFFFWCRIKWIHAFLFLTCKTYSSSTIVICLKMIIFYLSDS